MDDIRYNTILGYCIMRDNRRNSRLRDYAKRNAKNKKRFGHCTIHDIAVIIDLDFRILQHNHTISFQ
jgi:hypothetical protein